MKDRIKQIRESASGRKLSQTAFGEKIGVSRDVVANVEYGRVEPTDMMIKSICREFGVCESWLRTGTGDMFPPRDRTDEIAEIVNAALDRTTDEARQSLTERLSKLSDGEIVMLAEILERMFPS